MIGDRIKELRESAAMSFEAFGEIAGTSKQYVSGLEKGRIKRPNGVFLENWARHFGVNMRWLAEGKGPKSSAGNDEDGEWPPVRAFKLAASLGNGTQPDEYAETHSLKFRAESLRRKRLRPDRLGVVYGRGDSMLPTIKDGDAILFDRSDTDPRDGKLFVINYDGELYAKRLMEIDGMWFASSDNSDLYKPIRLDPARRIEIIGRVRWTAGWVD